MRHIMAVALTLAVAAVQAPGLRAEIVVRDAASAGSFPLVDKKVAADVFYDGGDAKVVNIAAMLLGQDMSDVTGSGRAVYDINSTVWKSRARTPGTVFIGTLGKSPMIDALVKDKNIDTKAIAGKWESYMIVRVDKPREGFDSGLVVIGSDRRGTAYGALALSEKIGVSPWTWWADVPVVHHESLFVSVGDQGHVQGSPSVKYRGLFINDEDWGMQPWAAKNFDSVATGGTGDIGPKTYSKIFELLLRLHANFCWPAMHDVTKAFNIYPGNKQVADDYAIVMGSSHCEPMLRNNVSEWVDAQGRVGNAGAATFNWVTNSAGIFDYWKQRLEQNGKFENVYTLGLRGIHDGDMAGGGTAQQKAQRLNQIMGDQRDLIKQLVNPDVAKVPQIFCPYKEVLTYYQQGAVPPDDVTLVWADDNHGYIRQLATPAEQKRSGGAGVYYHISYWGAPHDYLWLCSTPPSLIWEELSKAYDYGSRTLWVINVGDLKPGEIGLTMAMEMAADMKHYSLDNLGNFTKDFATQTFGAKQAPEIAGILNDYYHLNYQRKPEHMGFNTSQNPGGPIQPTEFSDDEITQRLASYDDLMKRANAVYDAAPKDQRDAMFELLVYPVRGSALQNQKILYQEMNRRAAAKGDATAAQTAATKSRAAYDAIQTETAYFNNTLAGGKWKGMMSSNPHNQDVFRAPTFAQVRAGGGNLLPDPNGTASVTWTSPATRGTIVPPPAGTFMEESGYVSIAAEHFTRKTDRGEAGWRIIPGLGREGDSVAVYPTTTPSITDVNALTTTAPILEYDIEEALAAVQKATITVEAIPTHRINPERGLRYAIGIGDETPKSVNLETPENNAVWAVNVLRGSAYGVTQHTLAPGKNTLKIYMMDPGVVIDHITIDIGGLKKSYLPPKETRVGG